MAALASKIQNGLDESRILVLGAQVLVGFEFRSFFEPRFASMPEWCKALKLVAVSVMLMALLLMVLPTAYHRIVARGEDRPEVDRFNIHLLRYALLPFALGLGLDFTFSTRAAFGARSALAAGVGATLAALGFWYLFTYGSRARHGRSTQEPKMEPTPISTKIRHVLTEARVVLPGAQALLGFQLAVTLMESFAGLPAGLKGFHLAALSLVALSVILLMTPAAYHRIVERGEETEHFHQLAGRLVIAAMVPLAFGLCADLMVVFYVVLRDWRPAVIAALVGLVFFLGGWFGLMLAVRAHREQNG